MHVRQGALPLKFTFLALNIYIFKKSPGNADATYWGLRLRTTGLEEIIYIYIISFTFMLPEESYRIP